VAFCAACRRELAAALLAERVAQKGLTRALRGALTRALANGFVKWWAAHQALLRLDRVQEEDAAARLLQGRWRGRLARKKLREQLASARAEKEKRAAERVQRAYRGKRARRRVMRMLSAEVHWQLYHGTRVFIYDFASSLFCCLLASLPYSYDKTVELFFLQFFRDLLSSFTFFLPLFSSLSFLLALLVTLSFSSNGFYFLNAPHRGLTVCVSAGSVGSGVFASALRSLCDGALKPSPSSCTAAGGALVAGASSRL